MFLNQIDTEAQRPLADHFAAALGGSGLRIAAGSLRAGSGWLYPDIRKYDRPTVPTFCCEAAFSSQKCKHFHRIIDFRKRFLL